MNADAPTATADRWERYWSQVGNEQWLTARELLDLSARVRGVFTQFVTPVTGAHRDRLRLDWDAAAEQVEREGLSSTEYRLARLFLALTTGRPVDLESLSCMGSWQDEVWRVLVEWATDGRLTTTTTRGRAGDVEADHYQQAQELLAALARSYFDDPGALVTATLAQVHAMLAMVQRAEASR